MEDFSDHDNESYYDNDEIGWDVEIRYYTVGIACYLIKEGGGQNYVSP